ncbi:MAG: CxxC-x17-CxxC domain-containing protein, partial [Candidatus Thorarchaeota archaeon]
KYNSDRYSNRNGKKNTTRFYKTVCSMCETETQVPFRPDGKRPVYCKICYQKVKSKRSD